MKNDSSGRDIKSVKSRIRKDIQDNRDRLDKTSRKEKSFLIAKRLKGLDKYRYSSNILAYYPFRSEIDTRMIIKDALDCGKEVALPRVGAEGLDLYYIKDLSEDLEPGSYDIMEPIPSRCRPAEPHKMDIVIVPGVGFDRKHNRLGYGGGFYDRLLAGIPRSVPRIALAFDLQVLDEIPVSGHDLKIDILITESQTI
jgi:5-formyltetrahydrofolate cyclo-ligase